MSVSIEDAKDLQRRLNMGDFHVAYICDDYFVMAHTDEERAASPDGDFRCCETHMWLLFDENSPYGSLFCCFPRPGWYKIASLHEVEELHL